MFDTMLQVLNIIGTVILGLAGLILLIVGFYGGTITITFNGVKDLVK